MRRALTGVYVGRFHDMAADESFNLREAFGAQDAYLGSQASDAM